MRFYCDFDNVLSSFHFVNLTERLHYPNAFRGIKMGRKGIRDLGIVNEKYDINSTVLLIDLIDTFCDFLSNFRKKITLNKLLAGIVPN